MKYLSAVLLTIILASCSKDYIVVPETYDGVMIITNENKDDPNLPPVFTYDTINSSINIVQVNDSIQIIDSIQTLSNSGLKTIYYPLSARGTNYNEGLTESLLVIHSFQLVGVNQLILNRFWVVSNFDATRYSLTTYNFIGYRN